MTSEELTSLVERIVSTKCEHQNIELKLANGGAPEKLFDTLSAFSNQTGGGIILFGIDEADDWAIKGVYDAQDLQTQVKNQAEGMEPVVRPVFTVTQIGGKTIVSAEIMECSIYDKPCFYKAAGRLRGSYVRVGDADLPMTEYEIYNYEVFKRHIRDELNLAERADMSAFSPGLVSRYLAELSRKKPKLASMPQEKILRLQGLADQGKPTTAGLVLLGEYPQGFYPQLCVIAMLMEGDTPGINQRFLDNQRIEGPVEDLLEGTLRFIERNTKVATIINSDGKRQDRREYPMIAVRETVVNALLHRDYSLQTIDFPVSVRIFPNRLEIESPGGLYGRITLEELGKTNADTRNPFLAGAMEVLGLTENRFSGIPVIQSAMEEAGLPPAEFENRRGTFRVTLRNAKVSKEQGTAKDLLSFCSVPRSRKEIADYLGMSTPSYVHRKYIQPLVDDGKLRMTIPELPQSKKQKYIMA